MTRRPSLRRVTLLLAALLAALPALTQSTPIPITVTPDPLTVAVGATGTLTATLSPTPTAAGMLSVSSSHPSVATVPASVSFASGQASVPVPVTAVGTGHTRITVSLHGGSATATVQGTSAPPTMTSLEPETLTITTGGVGTLTVTISAAQATETVVSLTSTASGIAFAPSSVTVPAGQTSAPFTVSANTAGTAQITASLNATSAASLVTVTPALPTVVSLLPPAQPVTRGAPATLTVTLSAAQPADTAVPLAVSPAGIVAVPATVTVPAGQTSAPIPVSTVAFGTALVQASLNGTSAQAAVQVLAPIPALVAVLPPLLPVVVQATGTLTVLLNEAQPTPTAVALSVDQATVLQLPAGVTVAAGQLHASFTVTGLAVGQARVTATLNGPTPSTRTAVVRVVAPPPTVVSLLPTPLPLQPGATSTLVLLLSAAPLADTVVPLTTSAPAVLQAPSAVTVPASELSVPVPVRGLSPGSATLTAALNGTSVSATVQVTALPTVVTGLQPGSVTVPKGTPGVLLVLVSRASTDPQSVSLTSSAPAVAAVSATVPVPAGALGAVLPVLSVGEGSATITATLNGGSASAQVVVTGAQFVALTVSPQTPTIAVGQSQPFTASNTFTDGTSQDVTTSVTWTSSDPTVATITASGVASGLAAGTTTITATSGSNRASTTLTVVPPPTIASFTPTSGTPGTSVTISGANFDPIASQNEVRFNGVLASVTAASATSLTTSVPSGATTGPITVTTRGGTATSATSFTVITGPTITGFSPTSGPVGTAVTITGQNFDAVAANNQVTFNGTPAIVSSASTTQIVTTVPQGATTGPITVTTVQGTGTSAQNFTVTASQAFTLSALPAQVTTTQGGHGSYTLSVTGGGTFTGVVALSVAGLPAGVTGQFASPTLAPGQTTFLTLTASGTVPAGPVAFTLTGTAQLPTGPSTQSIPLTLQVLGAGQTTFAGQVVDEENKPVKGAIVKLGSLQVTTDDGGNFLFQNPPAGADQLFFIDGGPASTPGRSLPIIPYKGTIVAGQANVLGFTPKLHFQKTTGLVEISNSTVERIVTDPEIPGFAMKIPAGVTITGWDGQPNTKISIRRVPLDQSPLPPLPTDTVATTLYMDYFDKPGGGTPSSPVPITFPNDLGLPPGTPVELWFYDEAPDGSRPNQWAQYGTGTVSADGGQVIPDINPATGQPFGQPRFCCGAALLRARFNELVARLRGGLATGNIAGGEPVDLATGQFTVDKTDVVLPGRLPVVFSRHYRTQGPTSGPFGPNTNHAYDIRILIENNTPATLILPGGKRLPLSRQPDGTFRNFTDPQFRGAVLTGGTLRLKDGTSWNFISASLLDLMFLSSIVDRNGNTITIARSGANFDVTTITDAVGRQLQLTYTSNNRLSQIQDPVGRTVSYAYDNAGRLATVTDPEAGGTRYTYDGAGRMVTITDARGITFLTNEYSPGSGRVLRQVQADGGVWQFRYHLQGAMVSGPGCPSTSGGVVAVVLTLPAVPCPTEESTATVAQGYTFSGGVVVATTVVDPRGNTSTHRFNGTRFATEQAEALGQRTAVARDVTNQVLSNTDSLGRKTAFTYDAAGNTTSITDPANQVTRFAYETTFNRVTTITDALNQLTEFTYDPGNGNLLTTKDPLNHVTTIAYNSFGQPTSVQGPILSEPPTTFAYDANGNLITTTDPEGNTTHRTYDAVSRLLALTDPRGLITQFRYDNLNRVTEIADARQGLTRFSYDPNGNLLTVTDAKGQRTTYTYDAMDRLVTRTDALGRSEHYEYDPAGNLIRFTDRKHQLTAFTYDALNRRIRAGYADGTFTTFSYDAAGRLTQAMDSVVGAIDFVYDVLDRLIKEVSAQGVVEYTYDALGRRTTMTANGGPPVSYAYDAASRLIQVAQAGLVVGLGYDAAGRRTSLTYPNGTNTSYTYDNASRLTNITHNGPSGLIDSLNYTYDAAGNRINLTRTNGTATLLPAAVQAAYDAANEQIQFNAPSPNQTFDANGNLTTQIDASGTTTYTWDARNRLIAISGPGLSASFSYDALGRRISKTINGVTTSYLFDGNDIIQEIGGGAVGASYVRSQGVDEAFVRRGSSLELYHDDFLGNTLAMTESSGTTTATYAYEPYGRTSIVGASLNSFQYTGRENDGTGLYYYRARYYSPKLARFLSEDPILVPFTPLNVGLCRVFNLTIWQLPGMIPQIRSEAALKFNAYVYAQNSPVVFDDPSGLTPKRTDPVAPFPCAQFAVRCMQSLYVPEQQAFMQRLFGYIANCRQTDPSSLSRCRVGNDPGKPGMTGLAAALADAQNHPETYQIPRHGGAEACLTESPAPGGIGPPVPSYWTCVYRQYDRP